MYEQAIEYFDRASVVQPGEVHTCNPIVIIVVIIIIVVITIFYHRQFCWHEIVKSIYHLM